MRARAKSPAQPVLRYNEIWVLKESRKNDIPDAQAQPARANDDGGAARVSAEEAEKLAHTISMW